MRKLDISVVRESISKVVSMLTARRIMVTQRGMQAYVSYNKKTGAIESLNVPYIPDDASEEFVRSIQGFIDHEIGHVLFSDPKVLMEANKAGARVAGIANMLEDLYVERKMAEAFQGSEHNLNVMRDFFFANIIKPQIDEGLKSGNVERARGAAIVAGFRAWSGQAAAQEFIKDPRVAELLEPVEKKLGGLIADCRLIADSGHALDLARKVKAALEEPHTPTPPAPSPPPEPDEEEGEDPGSDPGTPPAPNKEDEEDEPDQEEKVKEPAGVGTTGDPDEEKPEEGKPEEGETGSEKGEGAGTPAPASGGPGEEEGGENGEASGPGSGETPDHESTQSMGDALDDVPDFDDGLSKAIANKAKGEIAGSDYPIFSTEWDKVEPASTICAPDAIVKMEDAMGNHVGTMQKSLERALAAQERKAWQPGQLRGRISAGALYRTAVGDDRVFRKRTVTTAKNTAVSLLVDCSGSMYGPKIKTAAEAALALSTVLERVKVKNEVLGFTTGSGGEMQSVMDMDTSGIQWARMEPLYMPIFKTFEQRLDVSARSRLAHLYGCPPWMANNIDGESLLIAAHRLKRQKTERHILIVLSDGHPAGDGRGFTQHLKEAVKKVQSQGVEVIGVGIQDHSVKSFYKNSIVIRSVGELPAKVIGEMTRMLLA